MTRSLVSAAQHSTPTAPRHHTAAAGWFPACSAFSQILAYIKTHETDSREECAMSQPQIVATFFWGLLGLSVLLTLVATPFRRWRILLFAAACSLVVAMAALASFGIVVLLLTVLQLIIAATLYRVERERRV
jgi:hypothetical protein